MPLLLDLVPLLMATVVIMRTDTTLVGIIWYNCKGCGEENSLFPKLNWNSLWKQLDCTKSNSLLISPSPPVVSLVQYLAFPLDRNLALLKRWHGRGARNDFGLIFAERRPNGRHSPNFEMDSLFQSS